MHCHENDLEHEHCHEHEDSEPLHTDERCPACVFITTHVNFNIQPTTIPTNALCDTKIPQITISPKTFNPTSNIQKRAPPTFSGLSVDIIFL